MMMFLYVKKFIWDVNSIISVRKNFNIKFLILIRFQQVLAHLNHSFFLPSNKYVSLCLLFRTPMLVFLLYIYIHSTHSNKHVSFSLALILFFCLLFLDVSDFSIFLFSSYLFCSSVVSSLWWNVLQYMHIDLQMNMCMRKTKPIIKRLIISSYIQFLFLLRFVFLFLRLFFCFFFYLSWSSSSSTTTTTTSKKNNNNFFFFFVRFSFFLIIYFSIRNRWELQDEFACVCAASSKRYI